MTLKRTLLALLAVASFGAVPVATVSSSGTFELRGLAVNPAGVPSWPVMAGDVINTGPAPAVVQFRDGSRVTLSEKTKAKVEKSVDGFVLRLLSGTVEIMLAKGSAVQVFNNTTLVAAKPEVSTVASTEKSPLPVKQTPLLRTPPPPVSSR